MIKQRSLVVSFRCRQVERVMFFFSSRRRHTRCLSDWSSDVWSSDLYRWFKQERHVDKAAFFFYTIPVSQQAAYAEENGAKLEGIATTYEGGGSHAGENPAAPTFDKIGRASCRDSVEGAAGAAWKRRR